MASAYFADSINILNATNIIVNKNINVSSGVCTLNSLTATTASAVYLPYAEYIYIGNTTTTLASTLGAGGSLPDGIIIMWSGTKAAIPAGWFICDGTTVDTTQGTLRKPDLRGKFILCSDSTTVDTTGGNATFTLQNTHIPAHTHSVNKSSDSGDHNHSINPTIGDGGAELMSDIDDTYNTISSGDSSPSYKNHTHSYTTPEAGGVDTPTPISLIPRCYALIYIIKLPP